MYIHEGKGSRRKKWLLSSGCPKRWVLLSGESNAVWKWRKNRMQKRVRRQRSYCSDIGWFKMNFEEWAVKAKDFCEDAQMYERSCCEKCDDETKRRNGCETLFDGTTTCKPLEVRSQGRFKKKIKEHLSMLPSALRNRRDRNFREAL